MVQDYHLAIQQFYIISNSDSIIKWKSEIRSKIFFAQVSKLLEIKKIIKMKKLFFVISFLFIACNNILEDDELKSLKAEYVLPYPIGKTYYCSQGFNSSFSHHGTFKYSVDFDMPVGTLITAARNGQVVYVVENYSNDDHNIGHENVVIVMHDDSTYSRYSHLTTNGALVEINRMVMPGDSLALSGNTGESNRPHLHFDVTKTFTGRSDLTIPFDFINAAPRPVGLISGLYYKANTY